MGFPKQLAIGAIFTTTGLLVYDYAKATLLPSNFSVQIKKFRVKGIKNLQVRLGFDIAIDNSTSQEVSVSNIDTTIYTRSVNNAGEVSWSSVARNASSNKNYPIQPNDRTVIKNYIVTVGLTQLATLTNIAVTQLTSLLTGGEKIGKTFKATVNANVEGFQLTKSSKFTI